LHTEQKHLAIKALKDLNYSSRAIAKMVLGDASKKSTVNDYLKKINSIPAWPFYEQSPPAKKAENCFSDIVDDLCYYSKKVYPTYKPVKQKVTKEGSLKIMVIPDTQTKPGDSTEYLAAIGQYIVDKKPDVVVMIGDFFDLPSLSSYDKGKTSFEGRRLLDDLNAGKIGMKVMLKPLKDYQLKNSDYNPRMVFCEGNHESRVQRIPDSNSEYEGFIGKHLLELEQDWEVIPFLKPIQIQGISFVHYLTNSMTGKPLGGNALAQLKSIGSSFVVGHKQTLDVAIMPVLDGSMRIGIIAGASYPFDEGYKGQQTGNLHFRGIVMLHEAMNGYADPSFISTEFLINRLKGK